MYPETQHKRRIGMSSPMQSALADMIRRCITKTGTQSWRTKDVVAKKIDVCATLESIIDEKIAGNADDKLVMAIAYEFARQTRAKLSARRAVATNIAHAYEIEEKQQGMASVAQVRVLANKCRASLHDAWTQLLGHRDAIDDAIIATESEMLRTEQAEATRSHQRTTALSRLAQ